MSLLLKNIPHVPIGHKLDVKIVFEVRMSTRYLVIICLLLQSCSFKIPDLSRGPSSLLDLNKYKIKMMDFKVRALGSEKGAECSKEQLDEDFNRLMTSLKKDSCAENNFSVDRSEFDEKNCPNLKVEGLFGKIVRKTMLEEKAHKHLTYFSNKIDPEFISLYKEAQAYLVIVNKSNSNDDYSNEERLDLLASYLENILLPIRDLVVIKRSYVTNGNDESEYYLNLQPTLPNSLIQSLSSEQLEFLKQGPNPSSNPFYLELTRTSDGKQKLIFSSTDIIRRDVLTLLKAPTAKNYVMALKWMTLHMMLSQVYLYDTILGSKESINIPNSCQNKFNGNLPAKFNFKYEEGVGEQFLENIINSHGLSFNQSDNSYIDYYLENVNKDPTKDGYSGLVPFENYKNAKANQGKHIGMSGMLKPQFDDVAHFKTIMNFKSVEAKRVFEETVSRSNQGATPEQKITMAGALLFENILGSFPNDDIAEIQLPNGKIQQIYPGKQNLSPYLLERMKKNGVLDFTQLFTEDIKNKFSGKRIKIDFPSMYSSPVWRGWSLKLLADVFYKYKDLPNGSDFYRLINSSCIRTSSMQSPEVKTLCSQGDILKKFAIFFDEFRSGEKYIPTQRLEEKKFQNIYPFLNSIWSILRDQTELLSEAKPFELNFLVDQMGAGNPWARLKLGYIIAIDQLENQKENVPPIFERKGHWFKTNENAKCDYLSYRSQLLKIKKAGAILGLDLPLSYNHTDKILTAAEKDFIWNNIVEDLDHNNAQLFTVESNHKNFYQIAEDLSYKTILDRQSALNTGIRISEKARKEIEKNAQSNEALIGDFFLKLYKVKGDLKRQKTLFEEFSKVNGIDSTFVLKLNFLAVDDSYKKPIYRDILRQAAAARKRQILAHLNTFCDMDINDPKEFKNIFYSASKAQNELNQMAGLPGVPEDVLKKINEMSDEEFRDMWWGMGAGVAGMASVIVGSACTVASGFICAPLGAAMIIGGSSILVQTKITANELGRKFQADSAEENVKLMEKLGFANNGSSEEVHRGYIWTAFEAVSIFPLMNIATRSAVLGPKMIAVSAQTILQKTGKTAFKSAVKTAIQEEEVRASLSLLETSRISKNIEIDIKSIEVAKNKIFKIRSLYTSGEIDTNKMLDEIAKILFPFKKVKLALAKALKNEIGKVTVTKSKAEIDLLTAETVSNYFGGNPKEMQRLIKNYSGEKLQKAINIMNEINSVDRIGKGIPIFSGIRDWFMRMRNESLAKNASKILRIENELSSLSTNPGALKNYIAKNIEDFTDIFIDIPMRKRELPYVLQIQGMPEFSFINGRKIPILSMMSEGQSMKIFFKARARLVYESYKAEARASLHLGRNVQSVTSLKAFQSFQYSVAEMTSRKSQQETIKIMLEYRNIEEQLTQKLYLKYLASGKKMEYPLFKKMVVAPANLLEKATAEAIWESIPANDLMGLKDLGEFAHKVVQELANPDKMDEYQSLLSALRIELVNLNPTVLD